MEDFIVNPSLSEFEELSKVNPAQLYNWKQIDSGTATDTQSIPHPGHPTGIRGQHAKHEQEGQRTLHKSKPDTVWQFNRGAKHQLCFDTEYHLVRSAKHYLTDTIGMQCHHGD